MLKWVCHLDQTKNPLQHEMHDLRCENDICQRLLMDISYHLCLKSKYMHTKSNAFSRTILMNNKPFRIQSMHAVYDVKGIMNIHSGNTTPLHVDSIYFKAMYFQYIHLQGTISSVGRVADSNLVPARGVSRSWVRIPYRPLCFKLNSVRKLFSFVRQFHFVKAVQVDGTYYES